MIVKKNQRSNIQFSQQCAGVVPLSLVLSSTYGPHLSRSSVIFILTVVHWVIGAHMHDPCGTNKANQLKGAANPHGNIFVR